MPSKAPKRPNQEHGPAIYLNWLATRRRQPLISTQEYPLFTDAHIVAEAKHGPYSLLNTVAVPPGDVRPAVVLRYDWRWQFPHPDWSATDADRYHGGAPAEEIAALASLSLGVRFRAGHSAREFRPRGDPKGSPRDTFRRAIPILRVGQSGRWILPRVAEGERSLELLQPLSILPDLEPAAATSLIRAARMYQDALWFAESEPALAWLLLVSGLEAAAMHWRPCKEDPVSRFKSARPNLYSALFERDPSLASRVASEFPDTSGSTKKFLDFCLTFRPVQPRERPKWANAAVDWSDKALRKILSTVYDYRSKALHDGRPFPAPMCEPPYSGSDWPTPAEKPTGHISMAGGVWLEKDIPILLHTFEYITRGTLLNWWRTGAPQEGREAGSPKRKPRPVAGA